MRSSSATRARVLFAATVCAYVASLVVGIVNVHEGVPGESDDLGFVGLLGLALLAIAVVGTFVAVRRPGHPIGRVLLFGSSAMMLPLVAGEYAAFALYEQQGLPGGLVAAWLTQWLLLPALLAMPALLLLLFPDGQPAGPRWRIATWSVAVGAALYLVGSVLTPGRIDNDPFAGVRNPLGWRAVEPVAAVAADIGFALLALSVTLGATSMILRLRRSVGRERAQLKWLAAAAGFFALIAVGAVAGVVVSGSIGPAGFIVFGFPIIPVTAGVVILRHRLYDVDVVIRRTLIYTIVTATLLATYVALVLGLGVVLKPLTGGSDLIVAVSTLAVAGLFGPVRTRVQAVVDRRFYRDRYDANRVLDRFETRLRTDPDLQAIGAEFVGAVRETVQPTHLSLWLRDRDARMVGASR